MSKDVKHGVLMRPERFQQTAQAIINTYGFNDNYFSSIKDFSDRATNKDFGKIILRRIDCQNKETAARMTENGEEIRLNVTERKFDIPVERIKGYEKIKDRRTDQQCVVGRLLFYS